MFDKHSENIFLSNKFKVQGVQIMKWPIRKKLTFSFLAILFLLILSTAFSLILSNIVKKTSNDISDRQFPSMKKLDQMTILLYRQRIAFDQYFLNSSKTNKQAIADFNDEFKKAMAEYEIIISQEEKKQIIEFKELIEEYNKKLDKTKQVLEKNQDNLLGTMRQIAIADAYFESEILPITDKMHTVKQKSTNELVGKLQKGLDNSNLIMVIFLVFAIIVGLILANVLGKGISKPVVDLTQAADAISLGKFDTAINVKTHDEINELAGAIDRMRLSLKKAMERLTKK